MHSDSGLVRLWQQPESLTNVRETGTPQVATQMSEDKARQGGALGWKTRQDVVGTFADAAFKLGVSTDVFIERCMQSSSIVFTQHLDLAA